ncbi:MAG: sulfatase-like hydrolase/transferase [Roseiarcus sp.]
MVDQLAPAFLPIHGHRIVKAPNLQALAENSVVLERAYCASQLCSPSRASFMSGLLPSRPGVYDIKAMARFPRVAPRETETDRSGSAS